MHGPWPLEVALALAFGFFSLLAPLALAVLATLAVLAALAAAGVFIFWACCFSNMALKACWFHWSGVLVAWPFLFLATSWFSVLLAPSWSGAGTAGILGHCAAKAKIGYWMAESHCLAPAGLAGHFSGANSMDMYLAAGHVLVHCHVWLVAQGWSYWLLGGACWWTSVECGGP